MEFPIGQVFRVPPTDRRQDVGGDYPDLREVTRGRWERGLDIQKGMFFFAQVTDPAGTRRRPAFIFDSNNLEKSTSANPWLDVIDEDVGYALYHGDNKSPRTGALDTRGNSNLMRVLELYSDPKLRDLAPPILITQHVGVGGRGGAHRQFSGFGVPTDVRVQTQASREGHFLNLAVELALFGLEREGGLFSWDWIDARRDPSLTAGEANEWAPESWRMWLRGGDQAIGKARRNVLRARIVQTTTQREMTTTERGVIAAVYAHYSHNPYGFEGIASLVAQRVLGPRCVRGWITKRAGDGGIDFVSRLDVGSGFSASALVVLGQAKLRPPASGSVPGQDLARVVARLRRGWVGVFVTTAAFTEAAQAELIADEYPLVLVNGQRVAQELLKELAETGLTLEELFERELEWYEGSISARSPEHAARDFHSGSPISTVQAGKLG